MIKKSHNEFLGEVEAATSHEAQTERYLAEKTGTQSDLKAIARQGKTA